MPIEQINLFIAVFTICLTTGIAIVASTRYIVGSITSLNNKLDLVEFANISRDEKIERIEKALDKTTEQYNKDLNELRKEIGRLRN